MAGWIDLTNFAIAVSGLVIAVLSFVLVSTLHAVESWTRRFFTVFFAILIVYALCDLLDQIFYLSLHNDEGALLSQFFLFLESAFSSILMLMLTDYLLHSSGTSRVGNPVFRFALFIWFVYMIMLVATQFTTVIYYFTPDNVYHRGPLYPILLLPVVLLMVLNLAILLRRRSALSKRQFYAFIVYILVPLICTLIQMMAYGLYLIVLGTALASLFMFVFILTDQMEKYMKQVEENSRLRANNMVLQMRPHFIYNTMMSIYYLCGQDPPRAQQVILDFSSYLQKNFTAIVKEDTIPFTEELEHTRAYLAVEQTRFEGMLYVEFDTPHTHFRLPALTLQPIVENAVKHGVDPELDPLHILIRTRETGSGAEIIVEDDGLGFVYGEDQEDIVPAGDTEPHVALANIRERLAIRGGRLLIESVPGGGTVVTVQLDQRNMQ